MRAHAAIACRAAAARMGDPDPAAQPVDAVSALDWCDAVAHLAAALGVDVGWAVPAQVRAAGQASAVAELRRERRRLADRGWIVS